MCLPPGGTPTSPAQSLLFSKLSPREIQSECEIHTLSLTQQNPRTRPRNNGSCPKEIPPSIFIFKFEVIVHEQMNHGLLQCDRNVPSPWTAALISLEYTATWLRDLTMLCQEVPSMDMSSSRR